MKTGHKVSIGICDNGTVNGTFSLMMAQLAMSRSSKLGPFVRVVGSGLLSRQRNKLVAQFLDGTDSDWLLMIDTDELLTVSNFDRLCNTAHDIDRPVTAGLVFAAFGSRDQLYPTPVPTIFQDSDTGFSPLSLYPSDSIFQVDAAGTGCLLVHRSVLQKMRDVADPNRGPMWAWFWDGPQNGNWIGEDMTFCRQVRALGFPIFVDTGVILPHEKNYWLHEAHHEEWLFVHEHRRLTRESAVESADAVLAPETAQETRRVRRAKT
ncbi:hypothetical protein UFOVP1616_46 [uncultured Caudovirales phage]|uniref:Uncharacterized protein n=1 Tax=uncultured Caudovirales phage TaxID=2100421 RepID=A0A6J5SWC9_9CAUD|nr:hypothetical protein UFOVP1467_62 [uncultured Caudovirales phage]CAB4219665.1 hypothetical protein UFOVP1616_46 [uncultured Caudovirales phage]